jgi:hypothetical protein
MTFYQELAVIHPYLQSVRKLKNYLSIDVNFPTTWKLPKKYVPDNSVVENESTLKDHRCFSFVSAFEEKLVEDMLINLNGVIKYNKEREEKERLFETKVTELKQIFDKQNLENLKNLSFELTEKKLSLDDELTESE